MSFIENVISQAKMLNKTIVLPEGEDVRVLKAAHMLDEQKICKVIVLGNKEQILNEFEKNGWNAQNIQIIEPKNCEKLEEYTQMFYEMRKAKGITLQEAQETVLNNNYFATLMIKAGDADGMVSGAAHSTADTVRPALQIIKSARADMAVSAFFFMTKDDKTFIFADSGLTPNPDEQTLANIAIQSAVTAHQFGLPKNVAMLSYSTYGSAKGELVSKVQNATKIAKQMLEKDEFKSLEINLDGELQADAALVESVAKSKAPESKVAGKANILVFPDLNAGNIGYKLVQRLGGYEAYGPILQGLNAPVNDLSRGCSAEDIVGAAAITIMQSK